MKKFRATALSAAVLCSGCAMYGAFAFDSDEPLAEPGARPPAPVRPAEYALYRDVPAVCEAGLFAETTPAYDMGHGGVPASVGVLPLRPIAERSMESLVGNHFRFPLPGERPALEIDMTPAFISVRRNRDAALVKIKIDVSCRKCAGTREELFRNSYAAERRGEWAEGLMPVALYEAFNDISGAFLDDFRRKVPPGALVD